MKLPYHMAEVLNDRTRYLNRMDADYTEIVKALNDIKAFVYTDFTDPNCVKPTVKWRRDNSRAPGGPTSWSFHVDETPWCELDIDTRVFLMERIPQYLEELFLRLKRQLAEMHTLYNPVPAKAEPCESGKHPSAS